MMNQRTLKNSISATGIGVHGGQKVLLTLRPAPENTGIVFVRTDLTPSVAIAARVENIGNTTMCTVLEKDGACVATVEHLLSAFAGLGVDNAFVDLDAAEVPIMDGSSAPFVFLIQSAGIQTQSALKKFIRVKRAMRYEDGDRFAALEPFNGFKVRFQIDYNHPVFKEEYAICELDFSGVSYAREIARARTFGFISEFEALKVNNLALGASLDNAIALDDFKIINQDGLRYEDEFVKHKILDVIGDLYLLGYSILGAFSGYKSGHSLNSRLLRALLADADNYEIVTFQNEKSLPFNYMLFQDEASA
jgi:UDP-3-O-[3-hydroxymyristoyl] N-acetylglucosamine deacetylase